MTGTEPDPLSDRSTLPSQDQQQDTRSSARSRRRFLVGVLVAAVVLAGAGIATNRWLAYQAELAAYEAELAADQADLAAARAAAAEDVRTLSRASTAAEAAFDEHTATVDLALAHLSSAGFPVQERLAPLVDDVGEEHTAAMTSALQALTSVLEPPSAADGSAIVRDADGAAPAVLTVDVPALARTNDDTANEADDRVAAVTAYYRTFEPEDRGPARAEITAEAERLEQLAATLEQATASVREAVDDVEAAVLAAVAAARETGTTTLETLEYADDESREAFQAVLDELEALAATELPWSWEERSVERTSPFVGTDTTLQAYVTAAESAQASHEANTPPPPSSSSGGSGSGQGTRLCYRYSAWGGARLVLC